MKLVKRSKWADRPPDPPLTPLPGYPATHVFLHHAAGGIEGSDIDLDNDGLPDQFEAILRQILAFHQDVRGWRAEAYNFFVGHGGHRAEGRGWRHEGGATGDWADDRGISICAIGDYHTRHKVTRKLKRAIVLTIADGIEDGHLVPLPLLTVLGHQEKPYATACPGQRLMAFVPKVKPRVAAELKRRRRRRRIQSRIRELRARIKRLQEKL